MIHQNPICSNLSKHAFNSSYNITMIKRLHGHVKKLEFEQFGDNKDLNYWNSFGFEASKNGNFKESFRIYERIRIEKLEPDCYTLINLLRSSVDLGSLIIGRAVHCVGVVSGLCQDLSVNTGILSMYSKLGSLVDARMVFDEMPERDCVVWNVMISAYSQTGYAKEATNLIKFMVVSGVRPDLFTAIPGLSSIRQLKSRKLGREMHAVVIRNELDYQVSVHNALIDMYCECGCLNYARRIFDMVTDKTVVSWSSMIKGYVNHDMALDGLLLFSKMKLDGHGVDFVAVINILPACVNTGALERVKYLHGYSVKCGLNMLTALTTALLVSYAKCGCIEMARKLFDEEKINDDVITWNSMISAYAKHGDWLECFKLYRKITESNLKPDELTFLGLLTACVNSGLVNEGWRFFREMKEKYNYQPGQEHYACMVDLLGRAGLVNEARELVKTMPFKPDARIWGPLLSACKLHSESQLAEYAAEQLVTMEPRNAGNYVLLSNIYAAAGKWDGVAKMRSFLRDRGLKKTPGCSWLEINGRVHEFRVADLSHPSAGDIYTTLSNLELEIKEAKSGKPELAVTTIEAFNIWNVS